MGLGRSEDGVSEVAFLEENGVSQLVVGGSMKAGPSSAEAGPDQMKKEGSASTAAAAPAKAAARVVGIPERGRLGRLEATLPGFQPKDFLPKSERTLIVGDGDFSYSRAVNGLTGLDANLTTTVYDSEHVLCEKYVEARECMRALAEKGCNVSCGVDARQLTAYDFTSGKKFGRIMFQFPLVPSLAKSEYESLTHKDPTIFLWQCERLLHRDGLVFITSKDVKPYAQWRLEDRLTEFCSELQYFGKLPFQASDFPGYNCQNVGRDSMVKDTMAMTYIYGFKGCSLAESLAPLKKAIAVEAEFAEMMKRGCRACRAGPFMADADRASHFASKAHERNVACEPAWEAAVERLRSAALKSCLPQEVAVPGSIVEASTRVEAAGDASPAFGSPGREARSRVASGDSDAAGASGAGRGDAGPRDGPRGEGAGDAGQENKRRKVIGNAASSGGPTE